MTDPHIHRSTLDIQQDPDTGDLYLIFPMELLEKLQWAEGDTIIWSQNSDQSWSLCKKT